MRAKRREAKSKPQRNFNKAAAKASADKKRHKQQIFGEAIAYCKENEVGAKKCLSRHPEWKDVISWQ